MKRQGSTILLDKKPCVLGYAGCAGKKESEGPLRSFFDKSFKDTMLGEKTWEKAESALQQHSLNKALEKAGKNASDIDIVFAGDLLNQCIASSYAMREMKIPFLGQYGACSTMAQTTVLASIFVESGAAEYAAAVTSSHFCTAERQYRNPIDYGGQRTPTAQWTVTGSGALILGKGKNKPHVSAVTVGTVEDLGITDANNMGAAMAPAAAKTISDFLIDTKTEPQSLDLILTGDLGEVGTELLYELLSKQNIDISKNHNDCGLMIFDRKTQDVHAGGSGCGCSASVLGSYIMQKMYSGELKRVLFAATGSLHSPVVVEQGESIASISHAVLFES